MKFGYTILYVEDVESTVRFYERAFGLKRKMVHENEYGELHTGSTTLAFAARTNADKLVGFSLSEASMGAAPPPVEVGLVTDDVQAAFNEAVAAGAHPVKEPALKPWGQTVGYVRDNNGFLVELCTSME